MVENILNHFPPHTHPLTLVEDPDSLLAEEEVRSTLLERGFTLLTETDPLQLRAAAYGKPSREEPLIVITAGPLNELPYDLWQQALHVRLALHSFFPQLSYPVVRCLTPEQRWRLSQAPAPTQRLGRQGSTLHILDKLFSARPAHLASPANLLAWLDHYHNSGLAPMPDLLAEYLRQQLIAGGAFDGWPLDELLVSHTAFTRFVNGQWHAYVARQTGQQLAEAQEDYVLFFERDNSLHDMLPRLVRSGAISPVPADPQRLPAWSFPGIQDHDEAPGPKRTTELLALLNEQAIQMDVQRWPLWQSIAWTWAEVTNLAQDPSILLEKEVNGQINIWRDRLDQLFPAWLQRRYAALASPRIPGQHVFHVLHVLAYERRQTKTQRVALLVLDGMSLADWLQIRAVWLREQPGWRFAENLLLAQAPSITAVSRQALVSGLSPARFPESITHNRLEAQQWRSFWSSEDLPPAASAYKPWRLADPFKPIQDINQDVQALCLVLSGERSIDDQVHSTALGARSFQASFKLWLQEEALQLQAAADSLIEQGFRVYITSDHGHTEATGMGLPREGLTVQTRGKRARLYNDRRAALVVKEQFPDTILWENDLLLPENSYVLMPQTKNGRRLAFAHEGQTMVTHGGLTLDEMIVPFIRIEVD